MKRWTDEELEYLKENYCNKSINEVSNHLGRTISGCRMKAVKLGIRHPSKVQWSETETNRLISLYMSGKNADEIAESLSRKTGSVKGKISALGLRR